MSEFLCPLEVVQRDIYHRLLCSAQLATVAIVLSRPRINAAGELVSDTAIQQTLNGALSGIVSRGGKSGAAIEVVMPNFKGSGSNATAADGVLELPVIVRENPLFNMNAATGTRLSAESIALRIVAELHGFSYLGARAQRTMTLDENAITAINGADGVVAYQVMFRRLESFARRARVNTPVIAVAAGFATVTCGTAGATILYTLNGEYPGVNAAAGGTAIEGVEVYSAPVAVISGDVLRCVASKAALADSDLVEVTVS